jgi:PAS domain S-box-containing protein
MLDPLVSISEETELAILAAQGASGSWDWDIVSNRLHVDEHFAELYGLDPDLPRDALDSKLFFSRIHPEDRARMKIAVAGMVGGAETFSKEYRVLRADGGVRWMHGRGQTHFDADDRPLRFTGLLVDVTERRRAEERLRISQTAGGVGTFEHRDGFATVAVSPQFCRVLGLHPADALPVTTINGLVLPGEAPLIADGDARDIAAAGDFRVRRNDDGVSRWIARRGEILRDDEGSGHRFVGVIYDITASKDAEAALRELNETLESRIETAVAERARVEAALRQSQKMEAVGQLTGGIAHDFNNLLTIIIGNLDTAIRRIDATADPRVQRALQHAAKGAERAARLTQRLLAFSRQQPLDPRATDIGRLLSGMTDLLTRAITETIAVDIHAAPDLPIVDVDPHQLENAILNLAVNARDAMPGGGALSIGASRAASGEVVIAVADTGTGMSADTIAKAFDPFFTTKDVGKGTGLGLSMVHGFVTQSGGRIDIESTLGAGTTINLFFPAFAGTEATPLSPPKNAIAMGSRHETILVVEDDDDVRAYSVGLLRELGYRVIEAHDGAAAIRLLERPDQGVDLLLTDVVMPIMSGRELADVAARLRPDLRVLFTSGYPREEIAKDGRLEAGIDLLPKPFSYVGLAEKVREILDR